MRRHAQLAMIVFIAAATLGAQTQPAPSRSPILVELFTSEGCSDCPPADHVLQQLDPYVVVLSEHVDYFNNQGWRDPFSSHEFTLRQQEYATRFQSADGPYTPQMIVDGTVQFVGSDARRAKDEIDRAGKRPKAQIALVAESGGVRVTVANSPSSAGVFLALADDSAASDVVAGENRGRHLTHVAVLRSLRKIGNVKRSVDFSQSIPLSSPEKRVVVFLQSGSAGPIYGAAELTR